MHRPARRRPLPALLGALVLTLATACSSGQPGPPAAAGSPASPSSEAAAPSTPSGPELQVEDVLAGLDRRQQIAQLFVTGVPLDDLASGDALVADGVGGIFLAGRSEAPATDLAAATARWQSAAPGPALWVAADQEGGAVQSLTGPGFDRLPPAAAQGDLPADQLGALAERMGAALHGAGLNLNLAPVVDVVPAGTEEGNEPIGAFDRHYGGTAAEITAAAGTVLDGLAASGVTATLKHFPGLGRVGGNTDTSAEVTDTVTTAGDEQVAAFGTLARSPARPFVMTSSAVYAQLDPTAPATFSPAVLAGLLREQLGFDGVVVSDDLGNARAVRALPPGERAVRFLGAGGTLVLTVEPSLLPEMIDAVLARSDADPVFGATVDAAVRTALLAKAHAGLLPPA
jgi:beta-glucosidase-like glycosyl hydrolase